MALQDQYLESTSMEPKQGRKQPEEEEEEEEEEELNEPVSPAAHYFNSSALSVCVICVLESEIPIDNSLTFMLLKNVFLPINPRFSSIMTTNEHGVKQWKKVDIKLEDHVIVPKFPSGLSLEFYDAHFHEYLTEVATGMLPQSRPLWEIHIITYPTSSAAGTLVFKLHHSLGDGYSLMGALFSCFQRLDDPSIPLSLPSLGFKFPSYNQDDHKPIIKIVPHVLSMFLNTISDFTWGLMKSSVLEDDRNPIRSGTEGVEFLPISISTVTFSLDHIKQIKTKLSATVNDIITGIIFYGTRLYMQTSSKGSCKADSTALVLLNTRAINSYQRSDETPKMDSNKSLWGNRFAFLYVPIPKCDDVEAVNPLDFVYLAKKMIKRKRSSLGFYLTGCLLEMIRKFRGPEVAAGYVHSTLKNTSMAISNLIGPIEKIALANHPCKGMYFMMAGGPQSLTVTMVSYMGKLRVAVGVEKGFINQQLFISCLEKAFEEISKAAMPGT